ncbi:hypothetical protein PybrP1_008572 [[Pythium] brassicae (nom. inval.)]|nr:hypothetical protein PybrP1_008572 [[Pythium] brassicae (nom. inval.)]
MESARRTPQSGGRIASLTLETNLQAPGDDSIESGPNDHRTSLRNALYKFFVVAPTPDANEVVVTKEKSTGAMTSLKQELLAAFGLAPASDATEPLGNKPPRSSHAGVAAKVRRRGDNSCSSRVALSASISAAALLQASAMKDSAPSASFVITDLLKATGDTKAPLPLSPIKQPSGVSARRGDAAPPPALNIFASASDERQQSQQKQQAQTQYLKQLDAPESIELFAYASALCHRITGRYLPKAALQDDPELQKREIERVQRDPEILMAISTIRALSTQFKDVAHDAMGHRKELGLTLFRIEENYLKLFEKLMEVSLRMYWKYEQEHESERASDKASIARWKELHAWKKAECVKLKKIAEAKDIVLKTQQIQICDLEHQLRDASTELLMQHELEQRVRELSRAEEALRSRERALLDDLALLHKKHDDMVRYERSQQEAMREQQKRIVNEMRGTLREKDALILKQVSAIRELSVEPVRVLVETTSTQTEVDDDGLWDAQDGIPRYVSKTALHRMLWRRFSAFVTCKNCRGRPIVHCKGFAGSSTDSALPREGDVESVVAFPFYSLEQVITQIEEIYDDKFASDLVDESDGVAREELPKFVCEFFLKTHGLRQSAEVALYRLLISVKNTYRRHSQVKLFARFLNLLQASDLSGGDHDTGARTHERDESAPDAPLAPSKRKRTGYLDRSFLHVFLTARHYLLRPPPSVTTLKAAKLPGGAATAVSAQEKTATTPHVIQTKPTTKWVPLDHAVNTLKWYIRYLPDESVVRYCREVEYSTAIYAGGTVTEVAGNRLAVRAEMRRAMLATENNNAGGVAGAHHDGDERDATRRPRIVADVHRVLLLLLDALEQRQEGMERDLVALFDSGDTNHDCVLSYNEFKAIIRTRVPGFSDRRILRMFREALMGGADQSFALSMEAFVRVCGDHGLASLVPADRLKDPFATTKKRTLRSLLTIKASAAAATPLSSALDALLSPARRLAAARAAVETQAMPSGREVPLLELPGASTDDIPEELSADAADASTVAPSARAEEVEDDDVWGW